MREYYLKLDEYGISKSRYKELLWACRQYHEREKQIQQLYGLKAVANDGMPHGTAISNPTQAAAEQAIKLRCKQMSIETAAKMVDPAQWQALLKGVTTKMPFSHIGYVGSESQFYHVRRRFFFELDKIY